MMSKSYRWEKEAEKAWDERAPNWNARSQELWEEGNRKEIIPFIQEHLDINKEIIDVGCGDGYGSLKLHQSGYKVIGVDLTKQMIKKAKNRMDDESIPFMQADSSQLPFEKQHFDATMAIHVMSLTEDTNDPLHQLPFEKQRFDAIMAINVLEWTEDPIDSLHEFQRVLKIGGLLFIGILGLTAGPRANSYDRLYQKSTICNTMMPWEFQQLATENGFEYMDGFGVYKNQVQEEQYKDLSLELQQSLTFMWVFMFKKVGEEHE